MRARAVDEVLALYERWGGERYDEQVSQLAHALQTAALARASGAGDSLVAAALLHDVGHLLEIADDVRQPPRDRDLHHEDRGARYLSDLFGPDVTTPIELHVQAKRYLCAVDPAYRATLSEGSTRSLALQGGPLQPRDVEGFEATDGWSDAAALRRWDDGGKVDGLAVAALADYRELLEGVARAR